MLAYVALSKYIKATDEKTKKTQYNSSYFRASLRIIVLYKESYDDFCKQEFQVFYAAAKCLAGPLVIESC